MDSVKSNFSQYGTCPGPIPGLARPLIKTIVMSELNFNFPVVRDIEKTRKLHQKRINKLVGCSAITVRTELRFLGGMNDDDLFEVIMYENWRLFDYYPSMHWRGQKGVREIKRIVNNHFRERIINYLIECGLPQSWNTAYYLLHQLQIDTRMEAVAKLVYAKLS